MGMMSALGFCRQNSAMDRRGARLVSAFSPHGRFAPTVHAYTLPSMHRQDVPRVNRSRGASAGARNARRSPSATGGGTDGPAYRASGASIVPTARQYANGSAYVRSGPGTLAQAASAVADSAAGTARIIQPEQSGIGQSVLASVALRTESMKAWVAPGTARFPLLRQ